MTVDRVMPRQWALLIMCVLLLFGGAWIYTTKIDEEQAKIVESSTPVITDRGVLTWVNAFTKSDFVTCDYLVSNQDLRIYSPLVLTRKQDARYYEMVLKQLVGCLDSIGLLGADDGEYEFVARLYKFEPVSEFNMDVVDSLKNEYLNNGMSDSDFNKALSELYFSEFKDSCFVRSSDTAEFVFTLYEREVDGVVYVFGTTDFIDMLLQVSGMSRNISVFEESMKSEVDSVLKSGF